MLIRCYRDLEFNGRRAEVNGIHKSIEAFLEQDVQDDVEFCDELIGMVSSVRNGSTTEFSGTGNAHSLTIGPNDVSIEDLFTWNDKDTTAKYTYDDFIECVEVWRKFIS